MVDNQGNRFGVAPDKGSLNGPITFNGSDPSAMPDAAQGNQTLPKWMNSTATDSATISESHNTTAVQAGGYWLGDLASLGSVSKSGIFFNEYV